MFIFAIVASHVLMLWVTVFMWLRLRRFLTATTRIESDDDLMSYKSLVGSQMKLTLAGFILLAAPWAIWLIGRFVLGAVSWFDLIWVAIPWFANIAVILLLAVPANEAKQLGAANAEIKQKVDQIVETWRNKLLPDWQTNHKQGSRNRVWATFASDPPHTTSHAIRAERFDEGKQVSDLTTDI